MAGTSFNGMRGNPMAPMDFVDEMIKDEHNPHANWEAMMDCGLNGFMEPATSSAEATPSSSVTDQGCPHAAAYQNPRHSSAAQPLRRQFWKAGEYEAAPQTVIDYGQNRLRVHPKFLHSNATSHKWAFGAIAELLDNAIDEVQNGATFVKVDKIMFSPDDDYALLIQDDGGGMGPESLRRCLSFGFSDKCSGSSIGQYGNGFKTSTMRLGADVVVFSCTTDTRKLTLSVGLLSYTFLMKTGRDDVVVPMVNYEFDLSSGISKRLMYHGTRQFSSNLSTLLRWSPFHTEKELLKQFVGIGYHGTKVIVYNLWFNDAGELELDFTCDKEDIMISGAPKLQREFHRAKMLNQMHIANRYRYSLRVYASILYLHLPQNFGIILCGRAVDPHRIVNDLKYRECIRYRPQVGLGMESKTQDDVITTIGFLEGAPLLSIHGFNVYHKNRLILPFWPAGSSSSAAGKGVAGVLEANFIRPTHDKQDFEKSSLFQRLETRLREMMLEYWRYHCHLVGYIRPVKARPSANSASTVDTDNDRLAAPGCTLPYAPNARVTKSVLLDSSCNGDGLQNPSNIGAMTDQIDSPAYPSTSRNPATTLCMQRYGIQQELVNNIRRSSRIGEQRQKRKSCSILAAGDLKRQSSTGCTRGLGNEHDVERQAEEIRMLISENRKLKAQCLEFEMAAPQLLLKADKLRSELEGIQLAYRNVMDRVKLLDGVAASATGSRQLKPEQYSL